MNNSIPKTSMGNTLKIYVFPALVTILATLIWRDVTELRGDVKSLLAQSNIDKTKIEMLEREVRSLEQAVFTNKPLITNNLLKYSHDRLFKHEEIFDIKKYLNPQNIL
jgi:hypothetical protein